MLGSAPIVQGRDIFRLMTTGLLAMRIKVVEMAKLVGLPVRTLYRWRRDRPDLWRVLERGCLEIKFDEVRK